MASFYDYAVPLFLVVFLIICIMVFLWIKQQRDIEIPVLQKPVHSKPLKTTVEPPRSTPTIEGLYTGPITIASGATNGGSIMAAVSGSSSGSGGKAYTSQFDLPPLQQMLYGQWEVTPVDSYYDDYENREMYAIATQISQFNQISPAATVPSTIGSSLGSFDSGTTQIPWDKDNESYTKTDVLWGYVSEQASRSIFLKSYMNEVASHADGFAVCGEESTNYCYRAPLFNITTTDPKVGYALQTGQAASAAIGQLPMMFISEINSDFSNFSEIKAKRKEAIQGFLHSAGRASSHALGIITSVPVKAGHAMYTLVGSRKVGRSAIHLLEKTKSAMLDVLKKLTANFKLNSMIISGTMSGLAAASAGVTAATAGATSGVTIALTYLAIALDIFFGVFGALMMGIEAYLIPIVNSLFQSGGVCPEGTKPITDLLPAPLIAFLGDMIPAGSFLQTFDPFVCYDKYGAIRLRVPPPVPPFMSDRTLSLVYHSGWQTGSSSALPSPTSIVMERDPLPVGYTWLAESDLANSPNLNEITRMASALSASGSFSGSLTMGSAVSSANIAVKSCQTNTTPSADGRECLQNTVQIGTATPTLVACAQGQYDDGYNCWNVSKNPGCTGGDIRYTSSTTWNDTTGYFTVSTTPVVCPPGVNSAGATEGRIVTHYKDRLRCNDPAFPNNINGSELLCYANCKPGYIRNGALCVGQIKSYNREYMLGTYTLFKTQKYDPNRLKTLNDVTIPYCDFGSAVMLNRMATFYYNNSMANPVVNEDNTIQVQMITSFYGVIASSELSCDVACSIDFITYDPITGGNYSSYTGCTYTDDEKYDGCRFCYRRFYFIRDSHDVQGQFTVTGCTFVDYTAPDGMVQSNDPGVNLVPSLPKKFLIAERTPSAIIDTSRLFRELLNGSIQRDANIGLIEAGIALAGGILGAVGGGAAANAVAGPLARRSATKAVAKEMESLGLNLSKKQLSSLSSEFIKGLNKGATTGARAAKSEAGAVNRLFGELSAEAVETASTNSARTSGKNFLTGAKFSEAQAEALTEFALTKMKWPMAQIVGSTVGGLVGGVGTGLFTSMYLDRILRNAWGQAIPPGDITGTANTFVTGADMYNMSVASSSAWWTIDHGPIYELAPGFVPTINFCTNVKVSALYCKHKYVVRNMVNKYHNEYARNHIKEVLAIEPRGNDGCYYKFNEVSYEPTTNTEGTIMNTKEIILINKLWDHATCTFVPNMITTNIDPTSYPVRSYIDPSTLSLPKPKMIYPTRHTVYTSDLFARYVRVRPPFQSADITPNKYMPRYAYIFGTYLTGNPAAWPVSMIKVIGGISIYIAEESKYLKMVADDPNGTAKYYDTTTNPAYTGINSWNDSFWNSGVLVGTRADGYYMLYLENRQIKATANPTAKPALVRNANGRIISMYGEHILAPVTQKWPVAAVKNVGGTDIYMIESFARTPTDVVHIKMVADDPVGTAKYVQKTASISIANWNDTYWTTGISNGTRANARYVIDKADPIVNTNVGSSTGGDGLLNLLQISVFDVSGLNISTQMRTFATSAAAGAATPDIVVDGIASTGDYLNQVWQPATANTNTEYWEVDLSNNKNISEIMYFGGTLAEAEFRHRGVRFEFLYDNSPNAIPIYTHTLQSDDPIQIISMSSSSYTVPMYPIAGPIKIPRPIQLGTNLGAEHGCINRCQDKSMIESLITQYNNKNENSSIIKIVRAITPNSTTCEYEAEIVKTDMAAGSTTIEKKSITKQIISMQVTPDVSKNFGLVMARFVRIIPSLTPGTVLEFSRILVRNTIRDPNNPTDSTKTTHNYISTNKPIATYNQYFELEEIRMANEEASQNPVVNYMKFLTEPPTANTVLEPEDYPKIFRAADNDPATFFQIDLLPPGSGGSGSSGGNYEIFDITFVGCSDRALGGIKGIEIQLFKDVPGDQEHCCDGTYDPVYRYTLPVDDIYQVVQVSPPATCTFNLQATTFLQKPAFLQENYPPLSDPDTSGGIFSFSSIVNKAKDSWKALTTFSSKSAMGPITTNLQQSNTAVKQILATMQGSTGKTILNSTKRCADPDILKLMMTGYNIQKGAPVNGEFNITKQTMTRILKAGQSTPSTCDILFENLEENYGDYMEDITDKANAVKSVKTARFKFVATDIVNSPVAPDMKSTVYDISSNAVGLVGDSSVLSPVYSGPSCSVDCGNAVQLKVIADQLGSKVTRTATQTKRTVFTSVLQTFQNSPLSCEYKMTKTTSSVSTTTGTTVNTMPVETYVKAVFMLDTDGCTPLLSRVKEYDPDPTILTFSQDNSKSYLNGVEVTLPSLYMYDPTKLISKRVDSTVKNIS
jgi:hypothetical protein